MPEFRSATFAHDQLLGGEYPRVTRRVTIAKSGKLARGAVLGRITLTGKFALSVAEGDDGSEDPRVILAHDVDATEADVEAMVFLTGEFNVNELTFGDGHTADSVFWALADVGIFIQPTVEA